MKNGSEPVQKLKRYIHRNLALPAKMIHESIDQDEAQECLMEFAHRYIDALLTYCSDILKPGALTNIRSLPRKPLALVHAQQVISSCLPRRPKNSEIYPSERSVSTCNPASDNVNNPTTYTPRCVWCTSIPLTLFLAARTSFGRRGQLGVICRKFCSIPFRVVNLGVGLHLSVTTILCSDG